MIYQCAVSSPPCEHERFENECLYCIACGEAIVGDMNSHECVVCGRTLCSFCFVASARCPDCEGDREREDDFFL